MSLPASGPIRFHFDYLSPYAYLAWTQIHALAERHGREVIPVPVLFPALLNANGNKGPAEIASKRAYIYKDVLRTAHLLGVPMEPPPFHPFNPLVALRVSSLPMPAETRRRLVDRLFAATWGGGGGVAEPARVAAMARECGLDGDRAIADASTAAGKDRVRQQTDDALAAGVFGVPTMIVGTENFWGYDSFQHLERYLCGEDSIEPAMLERWETLAPSATR